MRKEFELSQAAFDQLLAACRPVPMIALQCGVPTSAQENANRAWKSLGDRMGFDGMTVQPNGKGQRFFTAEVNCLGIEIEPGVFSGCNASGGDCPECGK